MALDEWTQRYNRIQAALVKFEAALFDAGWRGMISPSKKTGWLTEFNAAREAGDAARCEELLAALPDKIETARIAGETALDARSRAAAGAELHREVDKLVAGGAAGILDAIERGGRARLELAADGALLFYGRAGAALELAAQRAAEGLRALLAERQQVRVLVPAPGAVQH